MKKKLDLNNLLAKYEGMSLPQTVEYSSPPHHYDSKEIPIEQQFYQTQNYQKQYQTSSQPITGNFQMSKSECEQFLIKVKEELRNEERGLTTYADHAMRHVHERFQANHEKIKREILQLLERAFQENQRYIREELKRQGNQEPAEFISVHKKIASFDEDVNRLLYNLKSNSQINAGNDYRKAIAEVVMKDFNLEMSDLRQTVKGAKQNYLTSLGEVEPDRQKIECIKRDLHQLFRLSKRTANLVQKSVFSVFQDNGRVSGAVEQQPPKEKSRKSFFNFGSD